MEKDYAIGVIVARMQVHELHEGHHHIINQVVEQHKKVIMFLGVPKFINTKNPLDFDMRKRMIQESYPDIVVAPLPDQADDVRWTKELDKRTREIYPHGEVVLYGSRDSFIPFYTSGGGKFDTKELEPLGTYTGTNIRKMISEEVMNSKDFRAGAIYQTYNNFPRVIPTVDVAPFNADGQLLLAKKYDEDLYRFVGGFVLPTDSNYELAARRVLLKEIGGQTETDKFTIVTNLQIDDWRFNSGDDKIMTTLFKTQILWGAIKPSDDIAELRYFDIDGIDDKIIVKEHKNLLSELKKIIHLHKK